MEGAITVRNLMEMNSGLKENLTFEVAPDTKFFYNTPAYAIMKPVLEAASKQSLDAITQAWLARPAGMHDTPGASVLRSSRMSAIRPASSPRRATSPAWASWCSTAASRLTARA